MRRLGCLCLLASVTVVVAGPSRAAAQEVDFDAMGDEAIVWVQEYLRVNTINPPGNETAGAEFFAAIFEAEGIEYEMAESAPFCESL